MLSAIDDERMCQVGEGTGNVWKECMEQSQEHAKMLSEVGLDFKNLIGRQTEAASGGNTPVGLGLA
jgi:hypothetical protein